MRFHKCHHLYRYTTAIFTALAENFGMDIWNRTVLGFSHGQLTPPNGMPYAVGPITCTAAALLALACLAFRA